MTDDCREAFLDFLDSPTPENYLRALRQVTSHPGYRPYDSTLSDAYELIEQGRAADAEQLLHAAMPNYLLSPAAHLCLAQIAQQQGDQEGAEVERAVAFRCVQGIQTTGDGSAAHPYLVSHVSDEYDLLGFLKRESAGQALVQNGDRACDRITCKDGSEIWFDVSALFAAREKEEGPAEPPPPRKRWWQFWKS